MKFVVEVGGFVTVYRRRKITVYASNEAEAEQKAIDKFIEIQSENGDCDEGQVNEIKKAD